MNIDRQDGRGVRPALILYCLLLLVNRRGNTIFVTARPRR